MTTHRPWQGRGLAAFWALTLACAAGAGCQTCEPEFDPCACNVPRELTKTTLPAYVIEPPDILLIDALRVIPHPPYKIEPLDVLEVVVPNALVTAPISGPYSVDTDGTINFGNPYGSVDVAGKTIEEAKETITDRLGKQIVKPDVSVYPAQVHGVQQIRGEHLVRPDGSVGLGSYGDVMVAGKTLPEAKAAIEEHLERFLVKPEVSVDVFAYNSKLYYVIYDGGGYGQQLVRLPVTGNDTVLDAVAQVNGLSAVADKRRIWVARPGPACSPCDQILPVDWCGITRRGRVETNYQLMPGDRLYVESDAFVTFDTVVARFVSPFERILGFTLLGNGTIRAVNGKNNGSNGNGGF
jgi:polysaccharide export outer membrane protein